MRRLALVAAVFAVAAILYRPATGRDNYDERISSLETRVAVLEGGTPASSAETFTIGGIFILKGTATDVVVADNDPDIGCYGVPGGAFDDVFPGTLVTIRDGEGSVIGSGSISDSFITVDTAADRQCAFRFGVEGLPRSDFYSIQVATREPVTYSFDQLEAVGWIVPITL